METQSRLLSVGFATLGLALLLVAPSAYAQAAPAGCESALGSGPTLPDPTTVSDACRVIDRYEAARARDQNAHSIRDHRPTRPRRYRRCRNGPTSRCRDVAGT